MWQILWDNLSHPHLLVKQSDDESAELGQFIVQPVRIGQ